MPLLKTPDPILALVDYLEGCRHSWRGWLLGGSDALDAVGIHACRAGAVLRVSARSLFGSVGSMSFADLGGVRAGGNSSCAEVAGEHHVTRHAVEEIVAAARQLLPIDEADEARIRDACAEAAGGAVHIVYHARFVPAASVGLPIGRTHWRFDYLGAGPAARRVLAGRGDGVWRIASFALLTGAAGALCVGSIWWGHASRHLWGMFAYFAFLTAVQAIGPACRRAIRRDVRALGSAAHGMRQLRRPRTPTPLEVVLGPDPVLAGRLYALLLQLAAIVQLSDPAQGGVLLDGDPAHLSELLAGRPPWPWSSLCRVEWAGGRRSRLLHAVEGNEEDPFLPGILRRAERVWLALPNAAAREEWERRLRAEAPSARVTVIDCSGSAANPADVHLDVVGLAERCLSGEVGTDEATATLDALLAPAGQRLLQSPAAVPAGEMPTPRNRQVAG